MSDPASVPPAPAAPPAVETEAPTRQKRERKQTAFLGAGDADDAPARKRVEFKPGRGTKLADIPNVAFRLSKISRKDDILKFIYRVLYKGYAGKQMTIKKDIGEFSGWTFANDAEREAKESLLSRAFKDTLHEILDLFEVPRGRRADGKKEARVARLMAFLTRRERAAKVSRGGGREEEEGARAQERAHGEEGGDQGEVCGQGDRWIRQAGGFD